jgi:hypothetical protein
MHVQAGENVVFRRDGRVTHLECPPVICSVCSRSIRPDEPIRRDGESLVHGNCWVRRYRTQRRAAEIAVAYSDVANAIRDRIAAGVLPPPVNGNGNGTVWAGQGSGRTCDGCERPIPSSAVECGINAGTRTLRFHRACLVAWQAQVRMAPPAIGGGSAASPWTVVFDLGVAKDVCQASSAYEELVLAGAETRAMCQAARERSAAARAATRRLRQGARCLRASSAAVTLLAHDVLRLARASSRRG